MKKAILNKYALNGYTVKANAPVGTILAFGGTAVPVGYLLCNGQEVSRTDYAALYNAIGTTYGSGDGTTTFNIPDLRECTLVGSGQNDSLEITSHDVYELGEFKDDQMQGHRHNVDAFLYKQGTNGPAGNYFHYGPLESSDPINDGVNGTPRTGSTTHGKQVGVTYIIKATEYASLEANAIDDTKATTGNTWSADKINKLSTYSTDEQVVGTFLDKPLYRKTWDTTTSQTPSQTVVVSNVDKLVNQYGFYTSGNRQLPFGIAGGSTYGYSENNSTTHELKVVTDGSGPLCFTLEYTKITD